MKNRVIRLVVIISLIIFISPTKILSQENFNFEITEIEIDQKNKKILGSKRGIITSNLGEVIVQSIGE